MEANDIRQLEPKALWQHFYSLTQVPRPSGKKEPVGTFIENFGKSLGLETLRDEVGNVLVRKPATPGMENRKAVVLQAHMDMVPQKNSGISHNFETDPIQAYIDGKDLYAEIASLAFNVPYDDCLEFRPDGTHNPEGKERRSRAKAILLGINYDKGIPAIADDLHISKKLAQEIYDAVLNAFPKLKTFREESRQMARDLGYVTTAWGRKRRLPDMQLDTYEFYWKDGVSKDYDPLADDEDQNTEVPEEIVTYYWNKLAGCKSFKQHQAVIEEANNEGIKVVDNRMKIADATRMCVNARVQGSAADLTKFAMLSISRCEELKQLGFRLLIQVHDEIIGECPEENKMRCAELLSECMIHAASLSVPLKCDVEITKCWYENE